MRPKNWRILAALVAALALALVPTAASEVEAAPNETKLSVVLLGDSYSAGNGAGSYEPGTEGTSYRSTVNWANHYVSWLNDQGTHTTLVNLAHSGATTHTVLAEQVGRVPANTDIVMLTIGGNDVAFDEIVKQCFAAHTRDGDSCSARISDARAGLPAALQRTTQIFEQLQAKIGEDGRVILLSYPLLSTTRDYKLVKCEKYITVGALELCLQYSSYPAGEQIRSLGTWATEQQRAMVEQWNASHGMKVDYVDTIPTAFAGHEPDPSALSKNDYRWINEFFETEGRVGADGKTSSKVSLDANNFYHPNITGHQMMAAEIVSNVGQPVIGAPVEGDGGDIDIVFVIDTTSSMWNDIDMVRANVASIIEQTTAASASHRFALVTYRDHPSDSGDPSDYAARVEMGFDADGSALQAALNAVTVDGGGDWKESVYSGMMTGLDLDWRPGVKKVMLVLGDAPAKDPEPVTGFVWTSVADRAFEIDPVEVYAIDSGRLVDSNLSELVSTTGGTSYDVGVVDDIPATITEAITTALDKPFAWLQGPLVGYVGEDITFDARGSYSPAGTIVQYEWDFDGDGAYDLTSAEGEITHAYDAPFEGIAGVRVTDSEGQSSVGSTPVSVTTEPEPIPEPEIPADKEGVYEVLDDDPLPFPTVEQYQESATISLSATTVAPGDTVTVSGSGFPDSAPVEVTLESTPVKLTDVTADSSGAFSTTVTIPANTSVGAHKVVATWATYPVSAPLEVKAPTFDDAGPSGGSGASGGASSPAAVPFSGKGGPLARSGVTDPRALWITVGGLTAVGAAMLWRRRQVAGSER